MDVSLESGARTLSRGLRTGSAGVAGLGALLLALAIIGRSEPRKTLVYRTTVRAGESLRIAMVTPAERASRPD
ncbi:MAG: hypothetical protein HZA58_00165 [Acidimicrobiia bacterium]|nr:hypothetical protein [Acidimicrobiia bacterium]